MTPLFVIGAVVLAGVLFVAAELAMRAWFVRRGRYYVWAPGSRLRMELDRDALPSLPPVVHFYVNRDGERGDDPPADPDGNYRILVAGGSAAECYFLDQKTSWPECIKAELSNPQALAQLGKKSVHIGNVARSLVACEHVCTMLEKSLQHYDQLDALVLMVGASDMVFWLEKGTPSVLKDETLPIERLFGAHPEPPFGWGPSTLALRRALSHWRHVLLRPVAQRSGTGKSVVRKREMRAAAERIVDAVPDPAPMLDHFERHFRSLLRIARSKARRVIVVRQPCFGREFTEEEERWMWQFGAGQLHAERVTTYYAHSVAWRLMALIDERAAQIAEEEGAQQVDLMPLLERNLETYYDEMHHTPKGNAVIGRAVAQRILALETPDPVSTPSRGAPAPRTDRC